MPNMTSAIDNVAHPHDDRGTGFLLWGWIVVTALNLGMVTASLVLFAP
jgi:hypothetical protein